MRRDDVATTIGDYRVSAGRFARRTVRANFTPGIDNALNAATSRCGWSN
jgi:hypothetical protein